MRRKDFERGEARKLRLQGGSLREIARVLDVSLSSVSIWVRDVPRGGDTPVPEPKDAMVLPTEPELTRRCGKCRKTLPESAFNRHPKGRQWWCRECFRKYFQRRGDLHRKQSGASRRRRQEKARAFVREYLSNHSCVDCGEGDLVVLEFDHVRPKTSYISSMTHNGAPVSAIAREIELCEVVCANCHRHRTAERGNWPRAKRYWWRAKRPSRSYATARNLAFAYSVLERAACVDCGLDDMCVLEFDHVSDKAAPVMHMARNEVSLTRLEHEISRCEIRCANCHRRRTARNQRQLSPAF